MDDELNEEPNVGPATPPDETTVPELASAGARLRAESRTLRPGDVEVAALRRRVRRRGRLLGAAGAVAALAIVAAAVVVARDEPASTVAAGRDGGPAVDRIVADLPAEPIDPTKVHLVSTVKTFPGCDALIGDLRRVGAAHVGSRGFGAYQTAMSGVMDYAPQAARIASDGLVSSADSAAGQPAGETLGTNVQVTGVDELDRVKADGKWIYDLDGHGGLRVTDATNLQVAGTVQIVPAAKTGPRGATMPESTRSVSSLLEADGRLAVFGSKTVLSKPVTGDPSATRSSTAFLTITFVDATDPARPHVTDEVQVEGRLVSARLVDGQIRLVTTSDMADLGFVLPTTPTSVPKALERNRRSVASSTAADWIPDWQRSGGAPQPLVPCGRVHVPTTFAGVAMTSLVSFPISSGRFDPEATSILAPGETLYAGTDDVAISSHVWVDPVDRQKLQFDDWQTAIHEFTFAGNGAPRYAGSGIVDGSTVGQFAFGEIGDALGVVTTQGTPWNQDTENAVDLTVLRPDGHGGLSVASRVADLAGGKGTVTAVRFTPDRVLVSTGEVGNVVRVIDADDPTHLRRAGSVTLLSATEYFHPLPDDRALLIGSRTDEVTAPDGKKVARRWVEAQRLDVADPDHPKIDGTWETPWATDAVGSDHHAFTSWGDRELAMWGVSWVGYAPGPNHAVVLSVSGGLAQQAFPEAAEPPEAPPPCPEFPVTDPELRRMVGDHTILLACGDASRSSLDWPRYTCSPVADDLLHRYAPELGDKAVFRCTQAPPPTVARVLVVDGRPILLTDQTLEALDPQTFASQQVVYHPTEVFSGSVIR